MSEQLATALSAEGHAHTPRVGSGEAQPSARAVGGLIALYEHAAEHHRIFSAFYSPPVGSRAADVVENRHLARAIDERMEDLQRQLGDLDPCDGFTTDEVERSLCYLREDRRRVRRDWEAYKRNPSDPLSETVIQLADEYEDLLRCHRALLAEVAAFAARMLEDIGVARRSLPTEGRTG